MSKSERNGARHEKFQSQFLKYALGSLQHRSLCIAVLAMDISTSEAQGGGKAYLRRQESRQDAPSRAEAETPSFRSCGVLVTGVHVRQVKASGMDVAGSLPRGMGVDDGRRALVGYAPGVSEERSPLRVLIRTRAVRPPPSLPHAYIDMYVRYTSCAPPSLLLTLDRAVSCHIPGALPNLLSSRAPETGSGREKISLRRPRELRSEGLDTLKEGRGSVEDEKESLCGRHLSSAHPKRSSSTKKLEVMRMAVRDLNTKNLEIQRKIITNEEKEQPQQQKIKQIRGSDSKRRTRMVNGRQTTKRHTRTPPAPSPVRPSPCFRKRPQYQRERTRGSKSSILSHRRSGASGRQSRAAWRLPRPSGGAASAALPLPALGSGVAEAVTAALTNAKKVITQRNPDQEDDNNPSESSRNESPAPSFPSSLTRSSAALSSHRPRVPANGWMNCTQDNTEIKTFSNTATISLNNFQPRQDTPNLAPGVFPNICNTMKTRSHVRTAKDPRVIVISVPSFGNRWSPCEGATFRDKSPPTKDTAKIEPAQENCLDRTSENQPKKTCHERTAQREPSKENPPKETHRQKTRPKRPTDRELAQRDPPTENPPKETHRQRTRPKRPTDRKPARRDPPTENPPKETHRQRTRPKRPTDREPAQRDPPTENPPKETHRQRTRPKRPTDREPAQRDPPTENPPKETHRQRTRPKRPTDREPAQRDPPTENPPKETHRQRTRPKRPTDREPAQRDPPTENPPKETHRQRTRPKRPTDREPPQIPQHANSRARETKAAAEPLTLKQYIPDLDEAIRLKRKEEPSEEDPLRGAGDAKLRDCGVLQSSPPSRAVNMCTGNTEGLYNPVTCEHNNL
ncbi:proteoglycan 4-like [Penaeus chinensis]|uniref:proteoglycan 4-like n=1 Tax=Penaeus chinensis TaxID=139456 RepID=UPI001FB747AA|nr:proteoglycan 4-like [Penaeus chinensis]